MNISQLIEDLSVLKSHSSAYNEDFFSLKLSGSPFSELYKVVLRIFRYCENLALRKPSFDIETMPECTAEDLKGFIVAERKPENWALNWGKDGALEPIGDFYLTFFLTVDKWKSWIESLNVFSHDCPLIVHADGIVIVVNGLQDEIYGSRAAHVHPKVDLDAVEFADSCDIPSFSLVRKHVRVFTSFNSCIEPGAFHVLTDATIESELRDILYRQYSMVLASCLCQEFYGEEKVGLHGVPRHHEAPLYIEGEEINWRSMVVLLEEAVEWAYGYHSETRILLIANRISIELEDGDESLIYAYSRSLYSVLEQAKHQFEHVILERQEDYQREVREFIHELKEQTVKFSDIVHSSVSRLLKDMLAAAFVFVAEVILSRKEVFLADSLQAELVYFTLSAYLMMALLIQGYVHLSHVIHSSKLLDKWNLEGAFFLTESKRKRLIEETMGGVKISFYVQMSMIMLIYLSGSVFFFYLGVVF